MNLESLAGEMVSWVWATPLFLLLLGCGLIFSVFSKFIQWRIMTHGYACIAGHYDKPGDTGHINHFQALCAALSATIGLGNIAGVAVAVSLGGPGAIFWMWIVGTFGMALKFMECTLAVMFRDVRDVPDPSDPDRMEADAESRTLRYKGEKPPEPGAEAEARGEVRGGPMWYMQKALVEPLRKRRNPLWVVFKILAVLFAVSTMLNSFGGGNMFQGWNVADMLHKHFSVPQHFSAFIVCGLVALVIIGGIKRIGLVASRLVPFMCVVYVGGALCFIFMHLGDVPRCLALIVKHAFTPLAAGGACAGVSVWIAFKQGMRRACFSNEAGEGSAAMAHAAAKTEEPIREGVVAGIGPFVDTILICTMSALVILMSGAWERPPVGMIESIDSDSAIVRCTAELPEKMEDLYLERIVPGRSLRVHTIRGVGEDLEEVIIPLGEDTPEQVAEWASLTTLTLDLSELNDDDRDAVVVGQPAHIDITGAYLTSFAFDTAITGFGKYMVTLGVCLFGFSTMLSWSYYGEKGAEYLLGPRAILPYKFLFIIFVFTGMILPKFQTVYDFSDATTGLMVLCNLPAVLILSPVVLRAAKDYFRRLDAGEMPRER
ncbi:MAG: alanine:cation symporter family protein [Phycisphaerales bacterium]|nr:MAG: alanine:cation symporter family protein [Phycisphaerales bacterium]